MHFECNPLSVRLEGDLQLILRIINNFDFSIFKQINVPKVLSLIIEIKTLQRVVERSLLFIYFVVVCCCTYSLLFGISLLVVLICDLTLFSWY